jgi:uncharacterized protein
MLVYVADKKQFLHDCLHDEIEEIIREKFTATTGKRVAQNEIRSWQSSLGFVAKALLDEEIAEDMGVAIELHIPQSSKRIDVTLSGYGADNQKNIIVIELKQWEKAVKSAKDGIVCTYVGNGHREVAHPSYQAWSYAALLEGFNEAVYDGGIQIQPCAYLHNYLPDGVIDDQHYADYISKAPLFLKGKSEKERLSDFIKQHVKYGDKKDLLYELDNGRIRPSKALADSLKGLMASKPEFVLIDDQKIVYESVLAAATTASESRPKVVIIQGGPGTGKTVLAINLLVQLTVKGLVGKYVSKNAAPRKVYETKLIGTITKTKFSNMFSGSGSYVETASNTFDFLIVDEAHRLNEKGGLYGNIGDNQIKELVNSAKCAVFFVDEDQRVALSDIGNVQSIEGFAKAKGALVEKHELASQFRCSGSDGYLAWLDHVLAIRETANTKLGSKEYDFKVFDTPEEMHQAISAKNTNNKARVVAGYCWPWKSKKNPSEYDIVIGNYQRQWNLDQDGSLWIIAEQSIEQVGCIHTCQGLEVDYIGVIIGPDLIIRDGCVITHPNERDGRDKTMRGYKTLAKKDPAEARRITDLIIKNTYRTLMTRGMKGCYIYSSDEETRNYFKSLLCI